MRSLSIYIIYIIPKANTKFLDQIQITIMYSDNCIRPPYCILPHSGRSPESQMDTAHAKEGFIHHKRGTKKLRISEFIDYTLPPPLLRDEGNCLLVMCYNPLECKQPVPSSRFHSALKCKQILR